MAQPIKHYGGWRIRWTDHTGTRRSAVFKKKRDAEQALVLAQAKVERVRMGVDVAPPPEKSFVDLAHYWLEYKVPTIASGNTHRSQIEKHLLPFFGEQPLLSIGVDDIRRFTVFVKHNRGGRRGGRPLSDKTVHNVLITLGSMFGEAVELGWLVRPPRIPKPRLQAPDFTFLQSLDDVEALVRAASEEAPGTDILYACAAYTGMRAGELAGLRKSRVDLARKLITVSASYDKPTKSRRVRHVPILAVLLPRLRTWLLNPQQLVFPNSVGQMRQASDRVFQETFHRCLERAGLPRMRFHDLRHTFASHWVMRGGDLYKLQNILGHSSPQMTARYAHLMPTAFEADWDRMGLSPQTSGGDLVPFWPASKKA